MPSYFLTIIMDCAYRYKNLTNFSVDNSTVHCKTLRTGHTFQLAKQSSLSETLNKLADDDGSFETGVQLSL